MTRDVEREVRVEVGEGQDGCSGDEPVTSMLIIPPVNVTWPYFGPIVSFLADPRLLCLDPALSVLLLYNCRSSLR
jgi:hypothetical protein